MKPRLANPALADRGARLAGVGFTDRLVPRFPAAMASQAAAAPSGSSPDGAPFAHFTESCPVAPSAVILSDAVLILVGSIALYEGCTLPKLIENWAATHARKIGLGALAREVLERSGGP